ncbi:amino acid adenylation domain-containing protein [Streptomyces sp. ISL-98]|uniref:non-ribosomal peptide synthetase n=1 Tax=Streptomyces sp. ISL-98 TaxID=2819192 RepID=UPI001BE7EBA6|nr:non-ribosomal peptide synthetase [Streptomyces sp. ISL-98]MBT2510606.1 amino acid adenylation domain-containing protein [Streptomyces sp. ISL-98]
MNTEPLPVRFAEQAARTPDAIAVVDGARTVTYRELDNEANRMARHLRGLGAGPETLIGVGLERGTELVVALLGVWKAGAAYVPLDPGQPPSRLAGLAADSGAALVLAGDAVADAIQGTGVRTLRSVETAAALALLGDEPLQAGIDADNIAYAIFTSGSTGRPKAVAVTHGGIANRVGWTVRKHGLGPKDLVLQKTSIGFDAAGWEIFAPLVSAGTVVLAPAGAERDPAAMLRAVAEHRVTVLQSVPSVLRLLAEEPDWSGCDALRLLFSAGEPLHGELVARLRGRIGRDIDIWNTYGPTECSIDITAQPVPEGITAGPVPIGRPIPGLRALVLDPAGNPVPIGVAGELYAGGAGLARGYQGRPDLTAERFVPDPYGPAGSRLYRTGDLVRWREDRTLDYVGRLDDQVKVNGVRIEPAEIEAALVAHPAVSGAVVTTYTADAEGTQKRLAAHLTTREALTPGELRAYLRERLPDSHIPNVFNVVDAFPLTVNGKVDRAALQVPEPADEAPGSGYVAPRDAAETLVAEVWTGLLKAERVGATDDFFALGGTSLQLTRLAARLRAVSGEQITLRGLFSATTVEAQARLLGTQSDTAAEADRPVRPVPRDGELPLSSGQHRMWFLDRMHPGSPEWVAPMFLRLPAATAPATVQRALDALAARHEILRTRYVETGGEPRQVIDAPGAQAPIELRVEDTLRDGIPALFGEQFRRGFDLANGPLWRALLARVPGQDHVLLLTLHHIACDGWSTVVLERELRELCAAFETGRDAALPDVTVQYADYAAWQKERLTDAYVESELVHWRKALDGIAPLDLPADRPRPAERDPLGAGVLFHVEPSLTARFLELGRRHGATPFMTLLTAFATLVARYSGQWDVPVGTPVAGRSRPEVEGTVGFFLNSLVVRCGLHGGLSFTDALSRVRDASREAFAHQDIPFERLVDDLQPERDLSRTPLYQVAFDLHSEGATGIEADAEDTAAFGAAWAVAKTDLSLFMRRLADGALEGALEYATSLFDEATVARMAAHFTTVIEAVTDRPGLALDDVQLLSPAERSRQLVEWNDTATEPETAAVLQRFEAQAATAPGAVALTYQGLTVSYGELDARANRLAHHLRARGIGAESRVAVLLDRGPDLVTALLAVWKAGGAYVPVDPSYPAERIASMLDSAGARVAVTQSAYENRFDGVWLVLADADTAAIDAQPESAPERDDDLDRLAYVIFTSGSTGRPKGVEVTHRGLANHVAWAARELLASDYGGAPLFSSVAFDLVVPNLWGPLVTGQRVFLLPQDSDMGELGHKLAEAGPFSFVKLTPSHLDILALQLAPDQAGALAPVLVVAGEPFTSVTLARWREVAPESSLINEYGPTEASVGTSVFPVPAFPSAEVLPIGRPLPNMAMYVLDAGLEPVPVGVTGELYVGGTGVARGYAGRPDLTAERFVPDPYGPAGARLYRTGDLVRQLPDSNVEFLGRIDDQVKIRGYRVELGEIQAVLAGHPAVREVFIGVHEPEQGDKRLVAYVVPAPDAEPPGATALAEYAALRLPEYMVPSAFVALDALPLNANGKVDRRALPAPDGSSAAADEGFVAPRTLTEQHIAEIWEELLGATVGAHDSFFQVGGNSILAIRLISRIQEDFEINFAVRTVFEGPTVAQLAAAVEERIRAEIAALPDSELMTDGLLVKEHKA